MRALLFTAFATLALAGSAIAEPMPTIAAATSSIS